MRKLILLFCLLATVKGTTAHAQTTIQTIVMSAGDSLRAAGNINGAIVEYKKQYEQNKEDRFNLYNYACALSIVGNFDSSFKYLRMYMDRDTQEYVMTDPDFNHIRADKRWEDIENRMVSMLEHKTGKKLTEPDYAKKSSGRTGAACLHTTKKFNIL